MTETSRARKGVARRVERVTDRAPAVAVRSREYGDWYVWLLDRSGNAEQEFTYSTARFAQMFKAAPRKRKRQ